MVYLDYASTTPMSYETLDVYNKISKEYLSNLNGYNKLSEKSKELYKDTVKNIASLLNVMESEITFTSGATEANNLSLIGTIMANQKLGKHIIISNFEHESINKICRYLEKIGYEISVVKNDKDGLIDFEDLKGLIREDTALVSICALNSDMGIRQPLKMIRQIIKKVNQNTLLHSDMAQAVGKISINLHDVDLASISSHKIFGPDQMGIFYHSDRVKISPLIFGTGVSDLNPINFSLANIKAFSKALEIALNDLDKREHFVTRLNEKICNEFSNMSNIMINKTNYTISHILSISLIEIDANKFENLMSNEDIIISSLKDNKSVFAVYNDANRAKDTIRISISYKTTTDDINKFIQAFKKIINDISI